MRQIQNFVVMAAFLGFSFSSLAGPEAPQCKQDDSSQAQAQAQQELAKINGEIKDIPPADCPQPFPQGKGPSGPPPRLPACGAKNNNNGCELRSLPPQDVATSPSGTEKVSLKYGFFDRHATNKKTVILIKGGPNSDSWVNNTGDDEVEGCKGGCNLIVVEIPGAGYNKFDGKVDYNKEVGVAAAAKMVEKIVQQEHLDNYVIAGHSYGTAVATAAASVITHDKNVAKPKGVLLMGTLGRATHQKATGHEVTEGAKLASDKVYNQLSPAEKDKFQQLINYANKLPPQANAAGKIAGTFLGPISAGGDIGLNFMKKMLALSPEQIMKCMNHSRPPMPEMSADEKAAMEYGQNFYSYAGCELVSGQYAMDKSYFFNNLLVSERPNACFCSSSKNVGDYDSKNWPIKGVPLYYVSAKGDFNTPPYQQEYHQAHQTEASSINLYKADGDHGLGYSGLVAGQCGAAIDAIFASSPSHFQTGMKDCTQEPSGPAPAAKASPKKTTGKQ